MWNRAKASSAFFRPEQPGAIPPHYNACDREMCCRYFQATFCSSPLIPFSLLFPKDHEHQLYITLYHGSDFVCMGMCVQMCALFLAVSPTPPPILNPPTTTHPPPPIIEADSASRACTRHTRWLQHLERSLGHYSSPHYRKRRRGGDKEEEEQLR